jgi:ribosomal protein L37AE/L43A
MTPENRLLKIGEASEKSKEVFKLKKSDLQVTEARMPLFIWKCPLCGKRVLSVYRDKAISAAKLHLERVHKLKVVVE